MEKIIKGTGYEFPARSSAASLLVYRRNFGRDGMKDLLNLVSGIDEKDMSNEAIISAVTNSGFDIDTLFRFTWVFASSANRDIPPMEEWLDTFEVSPFDFATEVLPQATELLFSMSKTTKKAKKK